MTLAQGVQLQIVGILTLLAVGAWYWARLQIAHYRRATPLAPPPMPQAPADATALPGAGAALARPPDLAATLAALEGLDPGGRYRLPLGWSSVDGRARLSRARLVGDTNHILITGQSGSGKDVWALGALLALCAAHPPHEVQIAIIDGKGLDFAPWRTKAHAWRVALTPGEIAPAMRAVTAERERRRAALERAGVAAWDHYAGGDLPLLLVYVSELSLLQDAVGKADLDAWMNSELAAGRAFGLRFAVATQTASNFPTRWRSQVGLFVAGYQVRDDADEPNTGLTTRQIRQAGATPPSELPAPPAGAGTFTIVAGREAVTARAPLVDEATRRAWLARLPDRPPVPAEPVPAPAPGAAGAPSAEPGGTGDAPVPADTGAVPPGSSGDPEVARIRAFASRGWSRNTIARALGGNRQRALARIRRALDAPPGDAP